MQNLLIGQTETCQIISKKSMARGEIGPTDMAKFKEFFNGENCPTTIGIGFTSSLPLLFPQAVWHAPEQFCNKF